ncbi:MAG: NfeD family protein [Clostridia bacterium]|nr:NfeD family protein [Clostridia bacterium]
MINWWNELLLIQQIFALIALPSTLLIIIQTILMLIGIGGDSGADADVDIDDGIEVPDDGLAIFSVRGVTSMLCITGWVAVALLETSLPQSVSIAIAIACGVATLIGMAYLMRAIYRLQSSGNIDIENCVGKIGEVYIPIPSTGNGSGKINLTVQEKFSEFTAITTSGEQLKTGAFVRVVAVSESGVLVVEPIDKKN